MPGHELFVRRRGSIVEETRPPEQAAEQAQLEYLFRQDTQDLYRIFEAFEPYLCAPELLRGQIKVQLSYPTQLWMVEQYYGLEGDVVRELLGKKLSSKARKDLDDVAESTRVPLRSCRRQFDNLRRVATALEESCQYQCHVATELQERWLLPLPLAARYTGVLLLLHLRMPGSQAARRATAHLAAHELIWCALALCNYWVGPGRLMGAVEAQLRARGEAATANERAARRAATERAAVEGLAEVWGLDLDKAWMASLREIRTQLMADARGSTSSGGGGGSSGSGGGGGGGGGGHGSGGHGGGHGGAGGFGTGGFGSSSGGGGSGGGGLENHTLQAVRTLLLQQRMPHAKAAAVELRLRGVVKALASIGGGLMQSKEQRDVLGDLVARVGDPLREAGLDGKEVIAVLEALAASFPAGGGEAAVAGSGLSTEWRDPNLEDAWRRFMGGVILSMRYMYRVW